MNVAILSINLHTRMLNYGAVLHSWFFQQLMLRRSDVGRCDVIDYVPLVFVNQNKLLYTLTRRSFKTPGTFFRDLAMNLALIRRSGRFQRFIDREMRCTPERYTFERLKDAHLPYDTVVFESDVIWSPSYFGGQFDPAFFGAIGSMQSMRKIAFAASMGNAYLTEAQKEECSALMRHLDAISMRETYASELIRTLTHKPVMDVVDPVLLAEPSDFDAITSKRLVKRDYLLIYFPIKPNNGVIRLAHQYAKQRGLKVVEVSCQPLHAIRNKTYAAAGIEDFLSLIRNASVVFCNSLHGSCLSLLFHREFYAFDRNGGEKYRNLCQKFVLEDRFVEVKRFVEARPINWPHIDSLREKFRSESLEWLDRELKNEHSYQF